MARGLGRGEGFTWPGDTLAVLPKEVDPGAIFQLQSMNAYLLCRHPEPPDAPVCGPHQFDGNPTLDVSACPVVGIPPLCCKVTGYPFQVSHSLHTQ